MVDAVIKEPNLPLVYMIFQSNGTDCEIRLATI